MRRIEHGLLVTAAMCFFAISPIARAQQNVFTFDPASTKVDFTLGATLHTVHGTMQLKRGEFRFNPATGIAGGEAVVDATSAQTGNESRDHKMHKDVLQSSKYREIVFTAERVTGDVAPTGTSQVQLSGTFELNGQKHPMTLPITIQRDAAGAAVRAQAKFAIPYVQWGLKNPSTLFLRVSDQVEMEIDAAGQLQAAN